MVVTVTPCPPTKTTQLVSGTAAVAMSERGHQGATLRLRLNHRPWLVLYQTSLPYVFIVPSLPAPHSRTPLPSTAASPATLPAAAWKPGPHCGCT